VVAWGDNSYGQIIPPEGLSNVVAIAAGGIHSFALRRDGTIIGWGDDSAGQLEIPPGVRHVVAIAAGGQHSLALIAMAPWLITPPQSQSVVQGYPATFNVVAGGTAPLSYQWLFNSNNIAGETNSSLTLASVASTNAGSYAVTVSNFGGATTSTNAILSVTAPAISSMSQDSGGNIIMQFTGPPGLTYQIEGSTNLFDWQVVGVCTDQGDGTYVFKDTDSTKFPARFYRVVGP
jgi:hypothetical protein